MKLANDSSDHGRLPYIVLHIFISLVEVRHIFLTTFRMCPLSQQIDLSISTELQKKRNKFSHDIQAEAICELLQ